MTFIREYIQDFNATRAYIAAGYSEKGASAGASRLLANVKIREAVGDVIRERCAELMISKERVLRETALLGFSNIQDDILIVKGKPDRELSRRKRHQAA